MTRTRLSVRLLAEILLIVGLAQAAVSLVLPTLGTGLSPTGQPLLGVLLTLLLAAPTLYWRCLALSRSKRPSERNGASAARGTSVGAAVAMTAGAQALGLALTAVSVTAVSRDIDAGARERFDRGVERIEAEVTRHFSLPLYGLNGLRGMYAAHGDASRDEFRAWVDSRNLPIEFPGVRGFGFVERLPGSPPGATADRFVIKYSEPGPTNAVAVGRDAVRDAPRREANDRAIQSGLPTLSAPITLTLNGQPTVGFVYLLAVYRGGGRAGALEREGPLTGVLFAPIIAKDILRGVTDVADGALDLQLYDGDLEWNGEGHLVFDGVQAGATPPAHPLQTVRILDVGGRTLSLRITSNPAFEASTDRSAIAHVAVGGTIGSLLLALTVWLLAIGRARAQRRAERMTADLAKMADRLTLAIDGGSDGLCDWLDVSADAQWWSPSFYALLGLEPAAADASQSRFVSLLHPDHVAAHAAATADALADGKPLDRELMLSTAAAGHRWFRLRAKVYRDADGRAVRMAGSLQDIHDRKQAERDLGRERKRLDDILEGTNCGTWEWNIETGKTRFNDRWAQMAGTTLAALGETTIETWTEPVHPDDRPRNAALLQRHFDGESAHFESESRVQHVDGHWIWVLDRGKLFSRDVDGRPRWMAGTRIDITERKQAEQALRDSESFLDRAGRIAGVGGWRIDLVSRLVTWTDQTCRIHDLAPGHRPTLGEALTFYTPDARPRMERAVADCIAHGGAWDLELPLVTATGRAIWVRAVGEAECEHGKPVRLVGAFQDVTERRALDAALRRGHELMAGILQNLPCGLSVFDHELRLVAHNPQFQQLLDLPEPMFATPGIRFDQFVRFSAERGEYDGETVEGAVERVLASVRRPVVQFFERLPAHGVPLEVRRAPMPGGGFVTTYTDISTRKRAEILLTEALARAEQASVTKSQFLANMSHEIRTPMNAILGMLGLLQKTPLSARQADYAAKTAGAARSLLGLLNDILDFSKADAGKMTLDPRPFRVDQLLRDLSVVLSASVGAKTIDVLYDIDPSVPAVLLGDDMRLQQVLINLGGNAIKFTAEGQVVLSLRVLERTPRDVRLRIAMQDSGIGIAPENQARIFTGFSQAEVSTTRRFGGTGLGLAICQRLVRLMGGELQVASTPGVGSTFHFDLGLPLAGMPTDALAAERPPVGPLRTLIVDNNATAREVFAEMAASLGWQVDVAPSGAAALVMAADRSAEGLPHEAVFIDWRMDGMDGWETARRLRERARTGGHPDPLLVMVTRHGREALAERSDVDQAMLSGFLVKPVTASMLAEAIADARRAIDRPEPPDAPGRAPRVRPLAGLRLLLVEDNLNNQQVAQELLTDEGAEVTLADNGQLGVAAVAAADPPFDAVLMDVQMPVMDGYTATAQIRQRLGRRSLPIIAMTANVMASDREACLAAGMNAHVGKPFDLAQLVAVLLRHTGRSTPDPGVRPAAEALPLALLDDARERGIELATALGRMGGNRPAYLRAMSTFVDDVATLPERLAALLDTGRAGDAGRLMHTVRGLAATLGIGPLAQGAAEAERRLDTEPTPTDARALLDRLGTLVASTLRDVTHVGAALRATLPETAVAPSTPPPDVARLRRSLHELATLLRTADMRALEVFDQLQQGQTAAWSDRLRPLDAALASLDFDRALLHCESLTARLTE